MKKFAFTLLLSLGCLILTAQTTTRQQAYWLRLYMKKNLPERWAVHWETDERRLIRPDRQLQFITHLHVRKGLSKHIELAAGATFSRVSRFSEWRPFQEVLFTQHLGQRWQGSFRFRMDERYQQNAEGWEWHFRYRFRLQLAYQIHPRWQLKVNDEFMWQDTYFDQNRIYAAAEYRFSEHFSMESGLMTLRQNQRNDQLVERDLIRISAYVNL